MKEVKCFSYNESISAPGKYLIVFNPDELHAVGTKGSYNVMAARMMNLTYAQYLRFCRDVCGAEIIGKRNKYPLAYFKKGDMLFKLVRLLNKRASLVNWEYEHPNSPFQIKDGGDFNG